MKKAISLVLALVLCLSLCACGGGNDAPAAEASAESAQTAASEMEEVPAAREVLGLSVGLNYLKDNLKSPSSLEVLNVRYVSTGTILFYYEIEYTAENSFGGADRDTIYMSVEVTFPTEKMDAAARMNKNYESTTDNFGIENASINARDGFNEYISDVQTMDKASIQKALG